jgi:coenzyme F420-reducing hydrogenase delta subunit
MTPTDETRPASGGDLEPRITAFVCNWCTYTGADLAGTSRLRMASNVRIIRLPCTGRIDPLFIIKAFERGADGVIVSGCHPADCHYTAGNYHARRRFAVFHDLMAFVGIDPGRITFSWVSASEGAKWRDVVDEAVAKARQLGPFTAYRALSDHNVSADHFDWVEELVAASGGVGCVNDGAAGDAGTSVAMAAGAEGDET